MGVHRCYQGSNLGFGNFYSIKIPSDNHYTIAPIAIGVNIMIVVLNLIRRTCKLQHGVEHGLGSTQASAFNSKKSVGRSCGLQALQV